LKGWLRKKKQEIVSGKNAQLEHRKQKKVGGEGTVAHKRRKEAKGSLKSSASFS